MHVASHVVELAAELEQLFATRGYTVSRDAQLEGRTGQVFTTSMLAESDAGAILVEPAGEGLLTAAVVRRVREIAEDVGADLAIVWHLGAVEPGAREAAGPSLVLWDRATLVRVLGETLVAQALGEEPAPLPLHSGAIPVPQGPVVAETGGELLPPAFRAAEPVLPRAAPSKAEAWDGIPLLPEVQVIEGRFEPEASPAPPEPEGLLDSLDDVGHQAPARGRPRTMVDDLDEEGDFELLPAPSHLEVPAGSERAAPPAADDDPFAAFAAAVAQSAAPSPAMPAPPPLPEPAPASAPDLAWEPPAAIVPPEEPLTLDLPGIGGSGGFSGPAYAPPLSPAPGRPPLLPVRLTPHDAAIKANDRLFGVTRHELVLQPVHLFDYECDVLRGGSLRSDTVEGRLQVHGTDKSAVEVDPDVVNPGGSTLLPVIPPQGVQEKVLRVQPERAKAIAVEALQKLHTRVVDVSVPERGSYAYTEKRKVSPLPEHIRLVPLGVHFRPVWRLYGTNGQADVDAMDGRVVEAQVRNGHPDAVILE